MIKSNTDARIKLRNSRVEDIDELVNLGIEGFGNDQMGVTHDKLKSHLTVFPEGQFCVEYDGKLVGSCNSLIVNLDDYGEKHTFNDISDGGYIRNHDPKGTTLYGIDVVVHPHYRKMNIGKLLYEARSNLCEKHNLKNIVFGGRMPNYYKYQEQLTPEEYVEEVVKGNLKDPVINFHIRRGFTYKGIIPNYISKDEESLGYATLMEWTNPEYKA